MVLKLRNHSESSSMNQNEFPKLPHPKFYYYYQKTRAFIKLAFFCSQEKPHASLRRIIIISIRAVCLQSPVKYEDKRSNLKCKLHLKYDYSTFKYN